ncbi:MAG: HD domain-containing protein [Alphaproteobacteria bacterium]|nr:HD domain-containing protein [Alphaproteobacteria bacterium]
MKKVDKIINFMRALEEVCVVNRDLLLYDGSTENDAMHIFKLSFLVMLIAPYLKTPVDYTKMLEMALVHDIAEGKTGDYTAANQLTHPELKTEKLKKEAQAIKELKAMLPAPLNRKIYNLYQEYEKKQTLEAKIVSALDKLEANLQANQYKDGDVRYWQQCENGSEYYKMAQQKKALIKEIDEPIITELENAIISLSCQNMAKYGLKNKKESHKC